MSEADFANKYLIACLTTETDKQLNNELIVLWQYKRISCCLHNLKLKIDYVFLMI